MREHAKGELAAELEQRRTLGPWSQRHAVVANPMPAFEEDRGQAFELDPKVRFGSVERQVQWYGCRNPKLRRPAVCRNLAIPAELPPGRRVAPHPEPIELGHGAPATSMTPMSVGHGASIG
jgi:hypothetical protein